ncbi:MAG: Nif3-like dinuclear metal center hexameric protein [Lachnospiraceae bacterium]|jgi:dinuclear metal center YbgI/SA1388 family protein
MKCSDVIAKLEQIHPPYLAESWDNVGLLTGNREKEVNRVFLALDATDDVIKRAGEWKADMLITHHPMIFSGMKQITGDHFIGRRVIRLIESGISYYAMHTNFDICGMADLSAEYLKLSDTQVLEVTWEENGRTEGLGRVGMLPQTMTLRDCGRFVKEQFCLSDVRIYGDPNMEVSRAAICTGSGKSTLPAALAAGAQVMITGDIDYHTGIDWSAQGIGLIDAGHYGTEYIFMEYMKQELKREFPQLETACMEIIPPYTLL